nr:MAG TPA: hypothetical protein [Caudoviricetes sp.]
MDSYIVQTLDSIAESTPSDTDVLLIGANSGTVFGKVPVNDFLKFNQVPKVKRITVNVGDLTANANKETSVGTELDADAYTLLAVSAVAKGGIPFMVSVNNISISSLNLVCRSNVPTTNRTVDVVILYY